MSLLLQSGGMIAHLINLGLSPFILGHVYCGYCISSLILNTRCEFIGGLKFSLAPCCQLKGH